MQPIEVDQSPLNQTTFLILAGGRGRRMNGVDKGLMHWQDKPMIEHLLNNLNIPTEKIIISANRNIDTYKNYSNTVIPDDLNNYQGPLAGILSAMGVCSTPYILCMPCDSPTPPENMLQQLWHCMQAENKSSALCHDGERLQPLFSLLSCQHKRSLDNFLQQGHRKVHDFMKIIDPAICDFSTQKDRFNNFNRPDDMNQ